MLDLVENQDPTLSRLQETRLKYKDTNKGAAQRKEISHVTIDPKEAWSYINVRQSRFQEQRLGPRARWCFPSEKEPVNQVYFSSPDRFCAYDES